MRWVFIKSSLPVLAVALISMSLSSCGSSSSSERGTTSAGERIINGSEVDLLASPQMVKLRIHETSGTAYICSGTVISDHAILTAGHCSTPQLSHIEIESAAGVFTTSTIHVHPGYAVSVELQAVFNDVAVVETSSPIPLPALPLLTSQPVTVGSQIGIWGFGLDENGESGTLKGGTMEVSSVTPNHIGAIFEELSNTCSGDSGGPATASLLNQDGSVQAVGIVGITSSGSVNDCSEGDYSLFTNVQTPEIISFIQSVAPGVVVF